MENYKELFELYGNEEESLMLNLLFVSLISSDTIITEEDAQNSMEELLKMKEALEAEDLAIEDEKKTFWLELVERGVEICLNDIERIRKRDEEWETLYYAYDAKIFFKEYRNIQNQLEYSRSYSD